MEAVRPEIEEFNKFIEKNGDKYRDNIRKYRVPSDMLTCLYIKIPEIKADMHILVSNGDIVSFKPIYS